MTTTTDTITIYRGKKSINVKEMLKNQAQVSTGRASFAWCSPSTNGLFTVQVIQIVEIKRLFSPADILVLNVLSQNW